MKIGIDPGNTGAIAILDAQDSVLSLFDMPCMALGKSDKQQVNPAELARILKSNWTVDAVVYLERVSSMPGQGVVSMFNFGMGFGIIQGVCAAISLPVHLVAPNVWKRKAGLIGSEKDAARTLAQQLYPEAMLGRQKDIGRADAILIARFGSKED